MLDLQKFLSELTLLDTVLIIGIVWLSALVLWLLRALLKVIGRNTSAFEVISERLKISGERDQEMIRNLRDLQMLVQYGTRPSYPSVSPGNTPVYPGGGAVHDLGAQDNRTPVAG